MKREILFRGKGLNNGEWVCGNLIQMDGEGSQSFIFPFYKYASSLTCAQIVSMFMVAVDPATVGQFTGLTDKNGMTKIFEGDIIRLDGTIGGNIYEEKELLKDTTNLIIKGVGTSSWATTEQEAIMRGCHYAE